MEKGTTGDGQQFAGLAKELRPILFALSKMRLCHHTPVPGLWEEFAKIALAFRIWLADLWLLGELGQRLDWEAHPAQLWLLRACHPLASVASRLVLSGLDATWLLVRLSAGGSTTLLG